MEAIPQRRYTVAEYLELERETGEKFQFCDGEVFAMAGGTTECSLLSGEIYGVLRE